MLNRIVLIGVVKKDVDIKNTDKGVPIVRMLVETEVKEGTRCSVDTHVVVTFGQLAEFCRKMEPGDLIYIEGRQRNYRYQRQGEMIHGNEVIANAVRIMAASPKDSAGRTYEDEGDNPYYGSHTQKHWT